MLELSSKSWNELRPAYGRASDLPDLLRQLKSAPRTDSYQSEPWHSIWSALCHQGDVYTATSAAIPHIVAIAKTKDDKERLKYLNFVGYAEACRHHRRSPPIPQELGTDYQAALRDADELFLGALRLKWGEEETKMLLGGLAAIRGHAKFGETVIDLDTSLRCPECDCDLSGGLF